jgi:hypothetical protein
MRFREHDVQEIPRWLTGKDWRDASWGGDACPAADFPLGEGDGADVLRVWVNFPDHPTQREVADVWTVEVLPGGEAPEDSSGILYAGGDESRARRATHDLLALRGFKEAALEVGDA